MDLGRGKKSGSPSLSIRLEPSYRILAPPEAFLSTSHLSSQFAAWAPSDRLHLKNLLHRSKLHPLHSNFNLLTTVSLSWEVLNPPMNLRPDSWAHVIVSGTLRKYQALRTRLPTRIFHGFAARGQKRYCSFSPTETKCFPR